MIPGAPLVAAIEPWRPEAITLSLKSLRTSGSVTTARYSCWNQ
jgi:hypothetical protein